MLSLALVLLSAPVRADPFDREYDDGARDHGEDRRAALAVYVGRRAFGLPFIGYFGCTGAGCGSRDDPGSRGTGQEGTGDEDSGSLGEGSQ